MLAASPSATLFSLNYDFHNGSGNNGNVWGITNNKDTTRNQTFTYDALNRLTSAQNAGTDCTKATLNGKTEYWGNSYSYDAWGNLLSKNVTKCGAENFSVAALVNNRLSGYGYDAAGNMTNDNLGNGYTYDGASRIAQVNGSAVTYTYGPASGERVRKDVNGQPSTQYYYFGSEILAERNVTSNAWTNYVFFDGNRVARRDSGGVSYYFSDQLKTASVMTDATGNIKSESGTIPGVANSSSPTAIPIITSSPAKNMTPNPDLTTSALGIMGTPLGGSLRLTGPPKQRLCHTPILLIRNHSIFIRM
jgi:hypothetical protein